MNNALLYLGGILITVLAILFAVPRFIDWNSYRGIFEEEATRILGREVRVGGGVNVRLLPAPYVSFERLRIADVGDDGGNSIIRVESFTMWLSVPPLLRGVVEAHRVEVKKPVLSLAVNAAGTGNWRTLAVTPGALPFAPKEVALQSVTIQDGAIIVSGPERNELARFEAINGLLNAEALDGPYKFRGQADWGGTRRHVRLATAKRDPNGDVRFKAAVDVADSGNSYVLDGRLSDLADAPKLEGALSAKLALAGGARPVPGAAADAAFEAPPPAETPAASGATPAAPEPSPAPGGPATPGDAAPAPTPGGGPRGFELKAKVQGTTLALALTDIAVSLEAGTTPQLITGQARFDWAGKMRLDVDLASRWLDLDQLAHTGASRMPLEAGRSYFEKLAAALPAEADTNARLEFDQITLGGEPISNVRLAAARAGGPLELKGVRADLPGGVRLELDGVLTPTAKLPRVDGALFVSGKSLMRFLAWGLGNAEVTSGRNDGPFSLDGRFALGDDTMALTDARAELSGTPLEGELKLDLGLRKKLAMSVEGPRIDVAQIGPGLLGLSGLRGLLFGGDAPVAEGANAAGEAAPAGGSKLLDPASADLALDLKVAELVDGPRRLTDVDAEIRLERGSLAIPRLRFATPEGLAVEAEGRASDVPAAPKGTINALISAPNAEAARVFAALLDLEDTAAADVARLAALAPLRTAATLTLAGGAGNATSLVVDGTLGGGRLTASLALDGGESRWRTAPLDLTATFDSPDVARLVATLFDTPAARGKAEAARSGRVIVKAAGVPAEGLLALADVKADGLALGYRGTVRLAAPGDTGLDGSLEIAAGDARVPLALAGVGLPEGAAGVPLGGTVAVKRTAGLLTLDGEGVKLGASAVSGTVTLKSKDDGRQTVAAKLTADKAPVAALLAPLLSNVDAAQALEAAAVPEPQPARGARPAVPPPEAATAAAAPIWPEQSFDLAPLARLDGTVEVAIGALALEPGLTIGGARLAAALSPEGVSVTRLEGEAVGGRLTSALDLKRAPAGIELSGSLRIDVATKAPPAGGGGPPPPGDAAHFNVSFASRALSPAAIIAGLSGKGELTIGDATLNGNSPVAVAAVARAALTGQGPSGGPPLTEAIQEALKQGEVKLGKITVPVEISDGALKLEKVRIDMEAGRSTFATVVELETMKIDSEWQIEPRLDKTLAANPARALLPPVTVVYAGKLAEFAALVPQVAAGALERELVVRKMELDVSELERLRKEDEERARREAERRRAAEAERARLEAERLERQKALEDDQAAPPAAAPAPPPNAVQRENLMAPQPQGSGAAAPGALDDDMAGQDAGLPPAAELEAAAPPTPPTVAPSPTSQRPVRRKRPADENWRPFQTPY